MLLGCLPSCSSTLFLAAGGGYGFIDPLYFIIQKLMKALTSRIWPPMPAGGLLLINPKLGQIGLVAISDLNHQ